MTPTLRAELDRIQDFLMGPEGGDLADVLSALRGPDVEPDYVKDRTTVHIRRAAFPKLSLGSSAAFTAHSRWTMWTREPFYPAAANGNHFRIHAENAGRVLELEPKC